MHDFYKHHDAKTFQQRLFRAEYFPKNGQLDPASSKVFTAQDAKWALVRNQGKLVAIEDIVGEIALEGALAYPWVVYCVVAGEVWSETAQQYFLMLLEGINQFPGFTTEVQGVYLEKEQNTIRAYSYVLDKAALEVDN